MCNMKKLFQWALAAALICGASVFTACSSNDDNPVTPDLNLSENIIGKWITAELNGQPAPTNKKTVFSFVSPTKAYHSASFNDKTEEENIWFEQEELDVVISGNKVTLTSNPNENKTVVREMNFTSINDNEFTANRKVTATVNGNEVFFIEEDIRYTKVTTDYRDAIVGTWQGRCTSEGSVFDDGQEHRWQYNADGTYVYYVKDGNNWVPYATNTLNEYFVDGNLLCTRWIDNGVENREWWEITIADGKMNWTALRQKEDGTTFTATFEMTKVN